MAYRACGSWAGVEVAPGGHGASVGSGAYSHAIRKGPMLSGPASGMDGLFVPEEITARVPTGAERDLAEAALQALPFEPPDLLYARVDLLDSGSGPIVIEVELTEPSLFVGTAPGAPERFAASVAARLARQMSADR